MTYIIKVNDKKIGTLIRYDPDDKDKIKDFIVNKLHKWVKKEDIEIIEEK